MPTVSSSGPPGLRPARSARYAGTGARPVPPASHPQRSGAAGASAALPRQLPTQMDLSSGPEYALQAPVRPRGAAPEGPLVLLPPMPTMFRRSFEVAATQWHADTLDLALQCMPAEARATLPARGLSGQGSPQLDAGQKDLFGRLAYCLTPRRHDLQQLTFYVGALQFVLERHGAPGLQLLEDAVYFLRQPMTQLDRIKYLVSLGFVGPEVMAGLRPLMLFCIQHRIQGAALPEAFERLSTCDHPLVLAERMLRAARAPGPDTLVTLDPRVLEMWLFIATEMPHEGPGDVSWAGFAGKAMLGHLSRQQVALTLDDNTVQIKLALLRETLTFAEAHRAATVDLMLPLLRDSRLTLPTAAAVLELLTVHGGTVRGIALALLTHEQFTAVSSEHLLVGVLMACRQAYTTSRAFEEPQA